ncbi:hypothetical protein [Streptomyces griseorubiginosus]|uniref:hypothetical protein n=1 Tax=Streptomyces griseorubiginosus TaxID=67304 RepID=UPI001AD71809|nr:hypothetical protein [Streptomyces griseorubiginosus]MBO4252391.1 hypothetical protein [Streptomyces griseorubiginosus]
MQGTGQRSGLHSPVRDLQSQRAPQVHAAFQSSGATLDTDLSPHPVDATSLDAEQSPLVLSEKLTVRDDHPFGR